MPLGIGRSGRSRSQPGPRRRSPVGVIRRAFRLRARFVRVFKRVRCATKVALSRRVSVSVLLFLQELVSSLRIQVKISVRLSFVAPFSEQDTELETELKTDRKKEKEARKKLNKFHHFHSWLSICVLLPASHCRHHHRCIVFWPACLSVCLISDASLWEVAQVQVVATGYLFLSSSILSLSWFRFGIGLFTKYL